ncbi:MAG: PilZ domain-containing protein [Candidatus Omnitrophica bacterium]|nr:PilZ domain-containing protein [Candidatus Omnitrophota bacterium]
MTGKTYKIICKNEKACQHFETIMSMLCDDRYIEMHREKESGLLSNHKIYKVSNERRSRRKRVNLRAVCIEPSSSIKLPIATTVNISSGGICLEMPRPIQTGKKIKIRLLSPRNPGENKEINGQVVWSQANKIGVQFQN